jgi:Zn-dependent alcohol dehydrogenase
VHEGRFAADPAVAGLLGCGVLAVIGAVLVRPTAASAYRILNGS